MKILAIETATEACSVALLDGDRVHVAHEVAPRRHTELVLGMVGQVLAAGGQRLEGLDAIAFGRGPGAFTGVRIAVGVVQGLAFGADLPVVPVSTLQALAQGMARERGVRRVAAVMDARMGEVYWGLFEADAAGLVTPSGPERVGPVDGVVLPPGEWAGCGSGWGAFAAQLPALGVIDAGRLPMAEDVARLAAAAFAAGAALPPAEALPTYLRDNVVQAPPAKAPNR